MKVIDEVNVDTATRIYRKTQLFIEVSTNKYGENQPVIYNEYKRYYCKYDKVRYNYW